MTTHIFPSREILEFAVVVKYSDISINIYVAELFFMPKRKPKPVHQAELSSSEDIDDISEDVIQPTVKKQRIESEQWIDKYQPNSTSEVCINPRKLKEVKDVLESMINGELHTRLLVLSGPSGSSKSSLIKCLAKQLIKEKGTLADDSEYLVEYLDSSLEDMYQPTHFQDFLDGCKYRIGNNVALILIEDLPNVFHNETLQSFRNCLRDWIHYGGSLPPLVLCLTEVELQSDDGRHQGFYSIDNNLTVETLLGRDVLFLGVALGTIKRVKFLPIAKTYMKKTLSGIVGKERIRPLRELEEFLTATYETGDIRSLISNLQFWSRSRVPGDFVRENLITLFHAVGKVIHSSGKFAGSDDDISDYQSVKAVLESYNNFGLLHLALLENYQIYSGIQSDLKVAANIADSLSLNDTLTSVGESEEYAIRATRNQLRQITEKAGRALPMKFPRHFKMIREGNKVKKEVNNYIRYIAGMQVLFLDVNLHDGHYLPLIYNSFRYRMKNGRTRFSYGRIGGSFQEILADEDLPVMENDGETTFGTKDQFLEDIASKIREQDHSEDESLSEDIEDTDDDLDDELDSEIMGLTQMKNEVDTDGDDDFLDDPELALLVSRGRL